MPWKIFRRDDKHCVHKEGEGGSMGDLVPGGCHETRAEAVAHLRALYASEAKEFTDETLNLLKEIATDGEGDKPERASAVLDEWRARVAEIPDDEVEEIKANVTYSDGNITTTESITFVAPVDAEIADEKAKREEAPAEVKKNLLERLKEIGETIKSWFKDEPDNEMSIWKEGETYWWMARYSNNFRDNDNPPEIISSASHKRFVELVKEGKAPLPELWVWHKKEWKVGKAHGLAYDDLGFAVAIGTFDVGKEKVAEALLNSKERILVSHGMPVLSIKRDESDPTIIVEHETREISPLPAWAAANKLTGFAVLNLESKEESMSIPDETKKEWISKLGIKPETLESLESANAADADKAINEGLERKETEEEVAQPATQETVEEPAPEVKAVSLTLEELQGVFQEGVAPLIERMNAIEAGMKELKEASEKREEVLKGTPAASLGALLGDFAKTAIGSPETRVDGRTSLAQSKPKETASIPGRTKIPFIDEMLAGNN